jgi:uncharacterized protein (TIGR02231 family)
MARTGFSFKGLLLAGTVFAAVHMPHFAHAEDFMTNSEVAAVTVYQNRAKVERESRVKIPKGAHTIVIENLPANIDANSIRVAGESVADVLIGTVKSEIKYTPSLTSAREKMLNDQIEKLQNDIKRLDAEKAALGVSQKFLQNLGEQAGLRSNEEIAELNLNSGEWLAATQTIQQGMSEILGKRLEIEIKTKQVNEEIRALQQELNKSRGGQKSTYSVSVAVESDAAAELALDLSYFTYNATWQPLYDARLKKDKDGQSSLELVQYGAVRQNTGEDWSDVELVLSTAQPNRNATLGDLSPYWVDMFNPEQSGRVAEATNSAYVPLSTNIFSEPSDYERAQDELNIEDPLNQYRMSKMAVPSPQAARIQTAQIQSNGFAVEYKLPGKVEVKSDGSESKLRIGSADVTHELKTVVRPQLSQAAYFIADMTVSEKAPLLGGQVALYRDDAFIGNVSMPFVPAGKSHELSYGLNDNVQVAFKVLQDKAEEAGYISDNSRQKQMVAEIENVSGESYDLVVEMAHPVSKNDDLRVTLQDGFTTKGYTDDWENVKGIMHWESELEPKSKKEYRLGYEITWPKGYNLTGRY